KDEDGKNNLDFVSQETDVDKILDYLSSKDECWSYEKEWRIINIEKEPNKPRFINMPKIKSITLGVKMDKICRSLLIDVCQDQDIPCYELVLGKENFFIDRKRLTQEDYNFDIDEETNYVKYLVNTYENHREKINKTIEIIEKMNKENIDFSLILDLIHYCLDGLVDAYFIKKTITHIIKNYDGIEAININELKSLFSPVEDFIKDAHNLNYIKDLLPNLYCQNKISHNQYREAHKQLKGISSVLDKIKETIWPL
ncbi:MAG: hypothetical protein LUI60_06720, partial [Clostridia bacterium]|nr:hypothetical protein [Clostridia bacterium]